MKGRTNAGRGVALISGVLICVVAVYAHVHVGRAGDDYTGPLALLDRVFELVLAAGLGAASFCCGRSICRLLHLSFHTIAEEFSIAVLLGFGAIGTGVLGLGLAGLLKPYPVVFLLLVMIVLSRRETSRLTELVRDATSRSLETRTRQVVAGLFLLLIAILTVRTLTPPHAVDEAIYHLSVTRSFVEQGRVHPVYDNFSGNMPLLVHMIYALCLMAKADIAAKLVSLALAVTSALAVYGFCARFLNRRIAALAMFAFFGAGMVVEVAVTSRIDVSLAGMVFAAAYAMMVHLETGERGWLLASAVLGGLGVGVKYTAGVWVALLCVLYIVESVRGGSTKSGKRVLIDLFAYCAIVTAVAAPWFIKSQVWFSNPVYPFLTGEVAEYGQGRVRYFTPDDYTKLNSYFDAAKRELPDKVSGIEAELADAASRRLERHPFRFWEYFTKPDTYNLGTAEAYHDPNYLFLLVPIAFFLHRRRWVFWLGLLSVVFYVFLASTSWIARYLLPIYPALTVLAVCALDGIATRLQSRSKLAALLPVAAVAVAVASPAFISMVQANAAGTGSFITGSLSRREFMSAAFYYPPIDLINNVVPSGGRVMMMGAQMCYDVKPPYIAEGGWDSVEWQRMLIRNSTLEEAHEDLKRKGVTHILYSPGLFGFVAYTGREGSGPSGSLFKIGSHKDGARSAVDYQTQLQNWATFELYRRKHLETIREYEHYSVLRLR